MSGSGPVAGKALRHLVAVASLLFALTLGWVMIDLPTPAAGLSDMVERRLGDSGVRHAVTAVLLNFRGYDTLLEIAVLLLSVLGMLALRHSDEDTMQAPAAAPDPLLAAMTHVLVPLLVVVAGYLLWAGAHRAGGAFQAGALLAAAGVLLQLGDRPLPVLPARALQRTGLSLGFAVFLAIALGAFLGGGALLQYPRAWAGELILLVESTLSISIGLMLLSLFCGSPARERP